MSNFPPLPVIDHTKEELFTSEASTFKTNPELFEKEWAPKVKAYNEAIEKALPKEYLVSSDLYPADLDAGHFNATEVPAKVLDKETLEITELPAHILADKIAKKEYTAVQVLTAFIKRATLAHQLTLCAMDIMFEEGMARAKELDAYLEKEGKTVGPFHGVPVSLKEHLDYKGRITHRGYVALLDRVPDKMALTPQIVYELGAVFYIRTTMPQSLMHPDSVNNITGRGRNAWKTSMSPGGSSSGEGALVAMKGSPLGIGGDIGGSVRFPAAFNGLWGIKPSTKRISGMGVGGSADVMTNEAVIATLGPMANSVEDLEFFMKNYVGAKPWLRDQSPLPIPWREVPTPKPTDLTIALVFDDGVVKPHPPVLRAMKVAEEKLKAAGFNVVTWEPHRVYEAVQVVNGLYTAEGNMCAKQKLALSGESLAPLTAYFLTVGKGDAGLTTPELMAYVKQREVLRQEYLELFNSRGVDFILSPTYVGVAPKPSTPKYWGYTSLWNLLDHPGVTFPSGLYADKELDPKDEAYEPRNKHEAYEYGLYDAEAADGLPIGLTLNGRRYTEEECLKAAKVVAEAMRV